MASQATLAKEAFPEPSSFPGPERRLDSWVKFLSLKFNMTHQDKKMMLLL